MAKIELCLNGKKPGNYGFFCPVSKLHLTVSNPIDSINADRVTSYILRGLKSKAIIDVKGVVNLETGELNSQPTTATAKTETPEPVKEEPAKQEPASPSQPVESESEEAEVAVEAKTTTRRGKKADKPVEESATQSEE